LGALLLRLRFLLRLLSPLLLLRLSLLRLLGALLRLLRLRLLLGRFSLLFSLLRHRIRGSHRSEEYAHASLGGDF